MHTSTENLNPICLQVEGDLTQNVYKEARDGSTLLIAFIAALTLLEEVSELLLLYRWISADRRIDTYFGRPDYRQVTRSMAEFRESIIRIGRGDHDSN